MRRLQVLVPLFFGLAVSSFAQQHFAAPPSVPAVAPRPVAAGAVGAAHPAPVHAAAPTHPLNRVPVSNVKPVTTARKRPVSTQTAQTHASNNQYLGTGINAAHGVPLPNKCNHFSYPLQGLNACPSSSGVVLPFFGGAMYIPIPYYMDAGAPEQPGPKDKNRRRLSSRRTDPSSNRENKSLLQPYPTVRLQTTLMSHWHNLFSCSVTAASYTRSLTAL